LPLELKRINPTRLRLVGLDERWLQDRIEEDPAILGLGDLNIIRREKPQRSGGRLDFLMYDPEGELRYEVEIMLGALDESHIIRTIEYWDIERQRFPAYDHRAVIVAEEITARFFNVIRLLNRAVPIIALQLNAFTIDNAIVLHFTKVLDVFQEAEDVEEAGDQVDRRYWEKKAGAESLAVLDQVVAMVDRDIRPSRVTWNKNHVALGTSGYNFCWFHPRKATPHCHLRLRTGAEARGELLRALEDAGVNATAFQDELITIKLSRKHLEDSRTAVLAVFRHAEHRSRTGDDSDGRSNNAMEPTARLNT
jgi:hypothetical protein